MNVKANKATPSLLSQKYHQPPIEWTCEEKDTDTAGGGGAGIYYILNDNS